LEDDNENEGKVPPLIAENADDANRQENPDYSSGGLPNLP